MSLPPVHPGIGRCPDDVLQRLGRVAPRPWATPLWATQELFGQRARDLVTADAQEAARRAIETARRAWAGSSGAAAPDGERWDAARAQARQRLAGELVALVPPFDAVRRLQETHLDAVFEAVRPRAELPDAVLVPDEPPADVIRPPFALERLGTLAPLTGAVETMEVVDRSFARREIGHLVVDADLAADPGAVFGLNAWFDLLPLDTGSVSAACGTAYALRRAGRLLVTARLRPFHSRVSLSLRDEWGFSSGRLGVGATMFIAVIPPSGGELFERPLAARSLRSDGDDRHDVLPDIEPAPVELAAVTARGFAEGETVFVLAGVALAAGSALNDMEAHVRALLWAGLEELTIRVVA